MTPCAPNVVLVDAGHLLYHVVWPVSGTTGDLAASFGTRLAHYHPVSKKIILFDRYNQYAPSAKDHRRTRRGRAKEVRLTPNTFIPFREEVILHNSKNKNLLNQTLCSYPLPHNTQLVNMQDCVFDDIDIFVLLVYWTSRMRVVAKIQMEKWNGDVLDINETVQRLAPKKCSQLLGIHALSGCDTVKKVSAQTPRDRYTRSHSSARSAWRDPRSAPGGSIHILLTPLRTEGMYNNE